MAGRAAPRATRAHIFRVLGLQDIGDDINIATDSRINEFEVCSKGDVVLLSSQRAGEVALHLELAGHALSLVYPWTLDHKVAGTAMSVWRTHAEAELWETQDLLMAVEYLRYPDDRVAILAPKRYI